MPTTLSEKAMKIKASSTLVITARAKELKAKGLPVITFSAGEPDFKTPDNISKAAIDAILDGNTKYTAAAGTPELRKAICKKLKDFNNLDYTFDQIVVSNGGKHTLHNIFSAILNPGDEVIIPVPYWLSYPEIVRFADGTPVFVQCKKENGFKLDPKDLEAAITPRTKAFVLNSPQNPTGAVYNERELRAIGELAVKYDFYIVADEMYEILNYTGEKSISIGSLSPEIFKKTIVSSGVSKSYAMTGWRIGYSASSSEIAKVITTIQSHQSSNPSTISQAAALEAISGPQNRVYEMARAFEKRRDLIYNRLKNIPNLSFVKPEGAFYIFVDFSAYFGQTYKNETINNTADIAKHLIDDYYVAVVPCLDFGMEDYIRFSYATSDEDIEEGMDRLVEFLSELR